MVRLVRRMKGSERRNWEVDTREGYKVSLELVQVDVQRAVETEGRRDGGYDLSDKAVQVREAGLRNIEPSLADIKNGFVIDLIKNAGLDASLRRQCVGSHVP